MPRKYIYGPFQSRRLGLSLGINILSNHKICTYNCVYCEIGLTKRENLVSPEYRVKLPPTTSFRKELVSILKHVPHLNSMSFTGYYGEPTLNENLLDYHQIACDVRDQIKWIKDKPRLTLFTNSSTLYLDEIRDGVKQFDFVLAKLDAGTEADFKRTNIPHEDVPNLEVIIDSLIKLKNEMPKNNLLAIQCLIYNSYRKDFISNDNIKNIKSLASAFKRIKPNIVQLYSIARIPSQYYVYAIDDKRKQLILKKFIKLVDEDSIIFNYY